MVYRTLPFFLLLFLLTADAATASAVDRKENEARTACLSGDYAKGVAILSELFVQTKDAAFIYNQGRCFEQNRRYEDAIARFEEFLRIGKRRSQTDRAEAEQHIAECQASLDRSGALLPARKNGEREARERAAQKACLVGDPSVGVAILTDLYLDTKNPTYLFNQGRCFEQNRRYEDAISRFREYLVKAKGLNAEDTADTERHIASCESYLRQRNADGPRPELPREVVDKPIAVDQKPAEVTALQATDNDARPGRGLRVAGTVVVAAGVAGIVTGLVLNFKVNGMSRDLETDWNPVMDSNRKDYRTAAWIAYSAGAACAIAGAIVYYLGSRQEDRAAPIAVIPAVGSDMAGAFAVGAF